MTQLQDRAESFDMATFTNKQVDSGLDNHRLNNEDALNCVRNINEHAKSNSVPECFPQADLIMGGGGEAPPDGPPRPASDERNSIAGDDLPGAAPKLTEEERRIREQIRDESFPGSESNSLRARIPYEGR